MTPLPSPEEVLNQNDLTGKLKCYDSNLCERDRHDIIYAMQEYAKLVLDVAAERATATMKKEPLVGMLPCVDKSSILKIKDEL